MFDALDDGTLRFLPSRLNHQPVIIGGLTADEMWLTIGLSAGAGLLGGIPLAFMVTPAMPLLGALVCGALGLSVGARVLRRLKRGRPETWLNRQSQLALAEYGPTSFNSARLVLRSGAWLCKRRRFV